MRPLASVALLALVTAGCARPVPPPGPASPAASAQRDFDERAAQVAAAWSAPGAADKWRNGFIPLGELTQLDGDPHFTGPEKVAYANGWISYRGGLLLPPPSPGRVTYPDGSTASVPLQTSEDAFAQISTRHGPCDGDCSPLTATSVTLTTMTLSTSRGNATVPAWSFTVTGLDAHVLRLAVAPSAIATPPTIEVPGTLPSSAMGAAGVVSTSGTTLTYEVFYGSCDSAITPLFYETPTAIVLGATVTHSPGACDLVGHTMSLTVTLSAPVGTRIIADAQSGQALAHS